MDDGKQKLVNCFRIVFPSLSDGEIYTASQDCLQAWDSVAAITLANVIEEEFQTAVEFEALADLTSFSLILQYLERQQAA